MATDPISDMLTSIRNANKAGKADLDVPASKIKEQILKIMLDEGYIKNFRRLEGRTQGILKIFIKYMPGKERVITGLKRVSRPGLKYYVKNDRLPRIMGGLGISIVSTSQGMMTDKEARKRKLGGEIICQVW
jgi:small subunit ribosomal protein S8